MKSQRLLKATSGENTTSDWQNNKSPGANQIPSEVFKSLLNYQETMEHFKALFNLIWTKGEVPQDFRDSYIINLFKNKGSAAECGSYRGIALLSIGGVAKVVATRLLKYVDQILPETQRGFRSKRGTSKTRQNSPEHARKC